MVAAAPPVTAPADLLDASAFPDADWAKALMQNKPTEAVALFVRGLRTGASRYSREDSIPAVFERWFGNRIGFSGGHHLGAQGSRDLRGRCHGQDQGDPRQAVLPRRCAH